MPSSLALLADDPERALDRAHELVRGGREVRIGELRDEQRVDPLAVGRAAHLARELGLDVRREPRAQLREAREVAVVRERDRHARELERVHVLQRDLDLRAVGDAAHVREHAARARPCPPGP